VILYNQSGEGFQMLEEDWWHLCDAARQNGWKPAGTAPPPIRLDIDSPERSPEVPWNQDYRLPQGQTVLRHDASALAAALRQVDEIALFTLLDEFIAFCERGGFILCPEPDMPLDALAKSLREAGEPVQRVHHLLPTTSSKP
jgi:hypothetical protein